jgi:hypothetical protein
LKPAILLLSKSRNLDTYLTDVVGTKTDKILLNMKQITKSKKYNLQSRALRAKTLRRQKFFRKLTKLSIKRQKLRLKKSLIK